VTDSNADAAVSEYAAGSAGSESYEWLIFSGDDAAYDLSEPDAFVAGGYLTLGGVCKVASVLPAVTQDDFVAAGYLAFSGTSVLATEEEATSAFVAAGYLALCGKGALGDGSSTEASLESAFAAAGYLKLGGPLLSMVTVTYPESVTTALAASGSFEIGGYCTLTPSAVPPVYGFAAQGGFLLGGVPTAAFLRPLISAFAAAGGFILESPGQEDVFETWVLSGQAFEPSIFSAFPFNSFANHQGKTFAAGEKGIFVLGGDDDDGEAFHTGARIGPVNLGGDRDKRIRGIQFGNAGISTRVRVEAETGEGVFTPDRDDNRVVVDRDIQGREFVIDFMDFLELSHLEITPLRLARR
jgi:hypothetical protein